MDFSGTFQLLLPWPEEDHIIPRSGLTAFYQSYGPLSVLANHQQKFLSPQLLLHFSRDIDETFLLLFPWPEEDHIVSRSCSTDFYHSYGPLAIFNSKSCLCKSSCSFQWLFVETFQLLLPWPEEDHIVPRSSLTAFYQSYVPLSVLEIKKLVCWKGCKISKHCLGHICYRHIYHILTFQTLGDTWPVAFYFSFYLTWAEGSRWAIVIAHRPSSSSSVCPSIRPQSLNNIST